MADVLDWTDAQLAAFLDLLTKINPPQLIDRDNCFEDKNLSDLLLTFEFLSLFRSILRPKQSHKLYYTRRLAIVQEIIENTPKFQGFRPYFNYLIQLPKSDPKIQRFSLDTYL